MMKTKLKELMNIPNGLTVLRILMVPAFVITYFTFREEPVIPFVVYVAAELTDALDGILARKLGCITWFGKLFDPVADKMMSVAFLVCLCVDKVIPLWMLVIVLMKELYMVIGASLLWHKKFVVKSDYMGKTATVLFVLSACMVMPWHHFEWLTQTGHTLMVISIGVSIASALHYTYLGIKRAYEKRED